MNNDTKDQEWQQMQHRISKFVDYFLKDNLPAIEYKEGISGLLQLPATYNEKTQEETK